MDKIFVNIILIFFFSIMFFTGCDKGTRPGRFEFVQFPRVVYIANIDTKLDFCGATLRMIPIAEGEFIPEPFPLVFNGDYVTEGLIGFPGRVGVAHSVDFTHPGIYEVTLIVTDTWGGETHFYVPFFVQVIDEEIFNQLSNPDHMPESEGTE